MKKICMKNISSLEKVLPKPYLTAVEYNSASCLKGEEFSYQIAFKGDISIREKNFQIKIKSDIAESIKLFDVKCVPVSMPAWLENCDEDYLTTADGVLPDILQPNNGTVIVPAYHYKAIWVSVKVPEDTAFGKHTIKICLEADGEVWAESIFELIVLNAQLPPQKLIYTQWFHADCISSYYNFKPLSEEHWEYIDRFMNTATEHGVNMLLTPIFTLALDTEVGGERPTIQLVDVIYDGQKYSFGFDKLKRWLNLCRKNRIEYIELSHLFTQWGAEHTPKIEVNEDGKTVKKFGWHTDSRSEEYKEFLSAFLPELTAFLKENWDAEKVYYHISDEPHEEHLERYGEICKLIKPYLADFHHIDALSSVEFYKRGYVETPVSTTLEINNFIGEKIENLWAYYCCCEGKQNLSNRYIAMPSYRNRIIGLQLYKFGIKGFLHWGYDFYYSSKSRKLLNPFIENDGDGAVPAGDPFSVYPGRQGALPSIRLKVFAEALQDIRALELLESEIGKDKVLKLIDGENTLTFRDYPKSSNSILELREKINRCIAEKVKNNK